MKFPCTALASACCASLLMTSAAQAGSGLLGLDHYVTEDDSGIWARKNQTLLIYTLLVGEAAAGVWEGGDTRFGRTMWKSIDATVLGGVSAEAMKLMFSRSRPNQSSDPNLWFQGSGHESFPSGEVTVVSAIVTPVMLEYGPEHPSVYALELLPVYDAIGRVKVHGHWQSDVIAGLALGTTAGYFMHRRSQTPIVLNLMPHGIYVGLSKRF
jgi:acid phosphatase family membrane protein YuiD